MENNENKQVVTEEIKFTKTSVFVLPIAFILNLIIVICFFFVPNFKEGLNMLVIWIYFVVMILYSTIAILDVVIRKDKKKLLYVTILASLVMITDILYIIGFYVS